MVERTPIGLAYKLSRDERRKFQSANTEAIRRGFVEFEKNPPGLAGTIFERSKKYKLDGILPSELGVIALAVRLSGEGATATILDTSKQYLSQLYLKMYKNTSVCAYIIYEMYIQANPGYEGLGLSTGLLSSLDLLVAVLMQRNNLDRHTGVVAYTRDIARGIGDNCLISNFRNGWSTNILQSLGYREDLEDVLRTRYRVSDDTRSALFKLYQDPSQEIYL